MLYKHKIAILSFKGLAHSTYSLPVSSLFERWMYGGAVINARSKRLGNIGHNSEHST